MTPEKLRQMPNDELAALCKGALAELLRRGRAALDGAGDAWPEFRQAHVAQNGRRLRESWDQAALGLRACGLGVEPFARVAGLSDSEPEYLTAAQSARILAKREGA